MNDVAWAAAIIGGVTLTFILLFLYIGEAGLSSLDFKPGMSEHEGETLIRELWMKYDEMHQ